MDENEALTMEELTDIPGPPDGDDEEWERKRREEWEAKIKPFQNLRTQINEHDELMADMLYEVTLLELGVEEE